MMLSDVIPVRKTLPIVRYFEDKVLHRMDSWWVFRGRVFGGKERFLRAEHVDLHEWWCLRVA